MYTLALTTRKIACGDLFLDGRFLESSVSRPDYRRGIACLTNNAIEAIDPL
jgi:hypothetical protein